MRPAQTVDHPDASRVQRLVDAAARHRLYRDAFELLLVALAFLLYFTVRAAVVDRADEALRHARDIINFERMLGIFWEPRLQQVVLGRKPLIQLFNFIYFWLDFPLIVAIGLWLYVRKRHHYTVARDALLLSGAIALVVYNLYPVMPPRLLPDGPFLDTLKEYSRVSYQADSTKAFVNPYAAVPSLHLGWAMIIGAVLFFSVRNWAARAFALLLPFAQLAAIIFTANHYITDAFAGLIVGLAGVALALALQRWGYPALRRWVEARWQLDLASE
ncbi:MAG: phosphatase PAP2 family protein [Dehalococcoidia bacterium]|nr:phosphatase PAP2 family protein [Dehalococcoidia bacterium]